MKCATCRMQLESGKALCKKSRGGCGKWTFGTERGTAAFVSLADVPDETVERMTPDAWWAPLIGGGFVHGCVYLVGGEPGAGKSTFALQVADACVFETGKSVLYLPSEEKGSKIRGRAARLGCRQLERIVLPTDPLTPDLECLSSAGDHCLVVCDSLSALARRDPLEAVAICNRLTDYAQGTDTTVLVIDHVTKGEEFAGFMTLQHAVDTTQYLRADFKKKKRSLNTAKDRHGEGFVSRDLLMTATGLILAPVVDEEETDGDDLPHLAFS
jgi:DNA repair protein RadA/Sms